MIQSWFFVLAMMAVLMIPGPTNALLASSAHQQGIVKTSFFIPAELLGYIYAISLWSLFIHLCSPTWPHLMTLMHGFSIVYVLWLAVGLWKLSYLEKHNQKYTSIRPRQLFFATFKNPKALLFAVGIFPYETWETPINFMAVYLVFALVLVPTALFWMVFGRAILANGFKKIKADRFYRGSALVLILCMLPVVLRFFN